MFEHLITTEFKRIFRDSIDTLLVPNAFTVTCLLKYENTKKDLCFNCEFDAISQRAANRPKPAASIPFARETICPVCNGFGYIDTTTDEKINMAIIFDSKYWLNWGSKSVNIPDGMVQSLCSIDLLPKLKNCQRMIVDADISQYGNYSYSLYSDPEPVGLGSHDYIISMWQRS